MTKEELFAKIESLMVVRNYSEAYRLINGYNGRFSSDPKFRLLSAKVLAGVYHYDEAMRILDDLLETTHQRKYDILREMGLIQEKNNSIDTAISTYKRMIQISPNEQQYFAKMRIAELEFKRGNAIEAIKVINSIRRNDSGQKDLLLAKIYRAVGLNRFAKNVLDFIVIDENNATIKNKYYLQRAYLDYADDDFASARSNLSKIKTLTEKTLLERRVLNDQIFFKSGGNLFARKALVSEFKSRSVFRWLTAFVLGDMDFYEKQYDIARAHYQMAINNSNDYYHKLNAELKLMRVEFRCEKYKEAKAYYDKVVSDPIFGKEANYAMIEECLRIGDIETAKAYYERITSEQISFDNEKHRVYGVLLGISMNAANYAAKQMKNYSYEATIDKVLSHEMKYSTLNSENVEEIIKDAEGKLSDDNMVGSEGLFDEYLIGGYSTLGYDDDWNELTAFRVKTIVGTKKIVDMIPRVAIDNVFTPGIDRSDIGTK